MAYSENATNYSNETMTQLAGAFANASTALNEQMEAFRNALNTVSDVWTGDAKENFKSDMENAIRILQTGKDTFDKWKTTVDTMNEAYKKAEATCTTAATQK